MTDITLEEFKLFLEREIDDTSVDDILNLSLDAAKRFTETYCNIRITNSTVTVSPYPITSSKYIELPYYPVTELVEVKFNNALQDISKFYITNDNIINTDLSFPSERNSLELTIRVGFTDIPSDLNYAIMKIAEKFFSDAYENRDGIKGYDTGIKIGEDYVQIDLPPTVEMILIRYKKFYI
jgi:hypothetical protein